LTFFFMLNKFVLQKNLNMKKLLIIEDDGDTLEMLGYAAESPNIEVVLKSKTPTIEEIQQLDPNLILVDHRLGDGYGGNLCQQIKSNPLTRRVPVVIMSAMPNVKKIASDSGADGSLSKPFDIDEVTGIFKTYLG